MTLFCQINVILLAETLSQDLEHWLLCVIIQNQGRNELPLQFGLEKIHPLFSESKQNQAIRDTKKSRKEYHENALAYVDTLLSIEEEKKYELVENFAQIAGVRQSLSEFFEWLYNSGLASIHQIMLRMLPRAQRRENQADVKFNK